MKMIWTILIIAIVVVGVVACTVGAKKELSQAQNLIKASIDAHGGKTYDQSAFEFDFRDKHYTFKHENGFFEYSRTFQKGDSIIKDIVTNDNFERYINNELQEISEEDASKYSGSVISVIYFAVLPYKLEDPAVLSEYKGETTIKDKIYHTVQVAFQEEGGGEDHQDIYYYWINKETNFVDYLAYSFPTKDENKEETLGIRFRSAYNPQTVRGIRFQDYKNFKAPYKTPLDELPILFEQDSLKQVSVIELKNIQ